MITTKMLSQQLKELEISGMIFRREDNDKVLKVEYFLTLKTQQLIPVLKMLNDWGKTLEDHLLDTPKMPN